MQPVDKSIPTYIESLPLLDKNNADEREVTRCLIGDPLIDDDAAKGHDKAPPKSIDIWFC